MLKPADYIQDLVPYVPGKPVEELERELGITGSIKIASNENPLGPSPKALKTLIEKLSDVHRYPDGDSFSLKRKLAGLLKLGAHNIILGNGSNEVIEIAARTYMRYGDEAIMGEYAFIVYPLVTKALGATAVISPMPYLVHDLRDMYKRISSKTKMIFLANPNNPTGTIVETDELEWFLQRVPHDIVVLIDEAYFEYVDYDMYPDSLNYHKSNDNIITVRTFSKIYGLAGLRLGYGMASEEIISYMNRVREPFNVNILSQFAAESALEDTEHVQNSKISNRDGKIFLMDQLGRLGIEYMESYANFILIDLKKDPTEVYSSLLELGVIVRPVQGYGLKTHLRITIGLPKENERFINALKKVLGAGTHAI